MYRTGTDSELMEILVDAARKGKEVTVVVELMARFDEEANINWAARLEEVGAHVVYGVVGHKTHAKMALVVRREETESGKVLRRYVHLATGNYHPRTARLYTDFGLMTANEEIVRRRRRGVQAAHRPGPRQPHEAPAGSRRSRCTSASSPRSATKRSWRPRASRRASSPR